MRTRGSNKHEHGTMRGKPDLKTRVSRAGIPAYDPKHRQSHSRVSVAGTSSFAIAMIRVHTLVAQKAYAKATRAGEKTMVPVRSAMQASKVVECMADTKFTIRKRGSY